LAENPKTPFPPVWFDFNNDGHLDLFVSTNLREGSAEIFAHYTKMKAQDLHMWKIHNATSEDRQGLGFTHTLYPSPVSKPQIDSILFHLTPVEVVFS
jgi:hypothetical protein